MKTEAWFVGKTKDMRLSSLVEEYEKRIKKYIPFKIVIQEFSGKANASLKDFEGEKILSRIQPSDFVILLDENGKEFTSSNFAKNIQKQLNRSDHRLVFIIGGAYGFSQLVYDRSNALLSLSKMTLTHQMVRLIFVEQLYRALTILRNEPYHH